MGIQIWLARAAWAVPIGLALLAANQADVATDLFKTLREGVPAKATVTEYERIDRADVTYGYVSLTMKLEDGTVLTREKMSMPHSLMQRLEGSETLEVRVLPNGDQDVVITMVAETQWKIAAIQSGISLVAALIALAGVIGWNRLLSRSSIRGDGSTTLPRGHRLGDEGVVGA